MHTVHVSLSSGGAYAVLHAAFWDRLDAVPSGQRFRKDITSMSGTSAGALVGASVASGVAGSNILHDLQARGLDGRMHYFRALLVYFKLKRSMYDGNAYLKRLTALCQNREYPRIPMQVAVTSRLSMDQHCVKSISNAELLNAAVASASIPYVLQARDVQPYGKCMDGSVCNDSFARHCVQEHLNHSSGTVVLINCVPWPGFRGEPVVRKGRSLARMLITNGIELYDHGMERLLGTNIAYQDGIYDQRYNNRFGAPVRDTTGNLRVIFVAPTQSQYLRCGGAKTIGRLRYKSTDAHVRAMVATGREMASEYLMRYGTLKL